MFGTTIPLVGLLSLVVLGFVIATTVNTFAMEAAVLFTPAFLFVFPVVVPGFPHLSINAAIGLALFVELFGYSSSVAAYWYRHQIDFNVAGKLLAIAVPAAMVARAGSYYVPSGVLMVGFGGLLVALAVVLYEAHEHGPSLVDTLVEKPEGSLIDALSGRYDLADVPVLGTIVCYEFPEFEPLAVLEEEYEPRTRVMTDTHDAAETPPSDTLGGAAASSAERADGTAVVGDGSDATDFHLEFPDVLITLLGGTLAGLVGIAIGELTQSMLALRRRVPLKLSTGTSALVLHVTIVAALVANVALLAYAPSVTGDGFTVPFGIGVFVATGCLFGGQAGAFLNNRLSEENVMLMLMSVYFLVGVFVVLRTVVLGGVAH